MSVFSLKIIACISMFIDHLGHAVFPGQVWMRYVGRLAFPIYCFLLTEGYYHTRDVRKYLMRLFAFGIISEIPFDLVLNGGWYVPKSQNVYFTLFLGLLMLYIIDWSNSILIQGLAVISIMCIAQYIHCDYRYPGIWMILSFACFRDLPLFAGINVSGVNIKLFTSKIQSAGALSLIPISLYNGKKGPSSKACFYAFYPVHLMVIWLLKMLIDRCL